MTSCDQASETVNETEQFDYYSLGDSIAKMSQQALLQEVSSHLQSLGPMPTLKYCNAYAIPITDSLSKVYGVSISRVSEKNRNPKNAASPNELRILEQFETEKSIDALLETAKGATYYKAIHLCMPACLKCHGKPNSDISVDVMEVINSLSPSDLAKDYSFGDFRGAWKIQFENE